MTVTNNAVEATPVTGPLPIVKNVLRGGTGRNPSFYRTASNGQSYCWLAVDSETGTLDFRAEDGTSLFVLDAVNKKMILDNLDLKEHIDSSFNNAIETGRSAQQTADQVLEQVDLIKTEGLQLQHSQNLSATKAGQLTLNGKIFKGEKGETGEDGPQGDPGTDGRQGKEGEPGKDGKEGRAGTDGQNGQDADEVTLAYQANTNINSVGEAVLFDKQIAVNRRRPVKFSLNFRQLMDLYTEHDVNNRKTDFYLSVDDEIIIHREFRYDNRTDAFLPDISQFFILDIPDGQHRVKAWYTSTDMTVKLREVSVLVSHI
jgi:hypothetical protein